MIEPCQPSHIREAVLNLRVEERAECAAVRVAPQQLMFWLYRASAHTCAFVCEAGVIAIAGDSAPLLALEGHAWLFTTSLIERFPVAFFREARVWLARQLDIRSVMRASILAKSERSVRFYRALGFEIEEPVDGLCEIHLSRP